MSEKILKAKHKGEIVIGDIRISCAVLEDGTRILVERSLANALGARGSGSYYQKKKKEKGALLPEYVSAKYLEPFIADDIRKNLLKSITYTYEHGGKIEGLPATNLVDICDIWHQAHQKGALNGKSNALKTADNAYIIFKGFAKVGITALVDEATGYQYERDKNELQKILSAYISDEVAKWQLTFTLDFYQEICRLWKQPSNLIVESRKRPAFFGTLTNKYVYKPIQGGVVFDELKQKSSDDNNKARLHQYLSKNIGREHLKRQIIEVTALMSVCNTKEDFIEIFKKKYLGVYQESLFADLPNNEKSKAKIGTPKELDLITKAVVSHKIDPNAPLPNNTFKKS